jgi:hypothetical protein
MTTECARCAVLEGLVDRYAWERGDAQRRMIEAQEKRTEAQREVSRLQQELEKAQFEASGWKIACDGWRDNYEGELEGNGAIRAKHGARENETLPIFIDRLAKERDKADALAAAYKRDFDAELAGNAALRQKYGARENETMFDFHARLVQEREAVEIEISRLRRILDRIAYPQHDATPTSGCTEECGRCNDPRLMALRALATK